MRFDRENAHGKVLHEWWQDLQGMDPKPREDREQARNPQGDRAGRAALRRCATLTQIALTPAYQRLLRKLRQTGWATSPRREDRLAAVAKLLAHVRENDEQSLAKAMSARDEESGRPRVSEIRFLCLLESNDPETLFSGLQRVLPLMQHKANVMALANDLIFWGDRVKREWAYAYDWPLRQNDT
jgi:CRISPR system Cascade subunit CasB